MRFRVFINKEEQPGGGYFMLSHALEAIANQDVKRGDHIQIFEDSALENTGTVFEVSEIPVLSIVITEAGWRWLIV